MLCWQMTGPSWRPFRVVPHRVTFLTGPNRDFPKRRRKYAKLFRGGYRRRAFEDYIPQRKAAVWTGASHRRFISSSSIDTVTEQPAISSDVTKLPTSDRVTIVPAGSSNRPTASYIR